MAKQSTDTEIFKPLTEEQLMLIQPNNVTFSSYLISEWQENILTLITEQLQKHITREQLLPKDLMGQYYVEIFADEAGGLNNKTKVLAECANLADKSFSFRWIHPTIHRTIKTRGHIITTIHDVENTNRITINLNPWAIPVLLYAGAGVGGTYFDKPVALGLRGNYTKKIYKIVCSQRDKISYDYDLEQFKHDMCISLDKDNYYLKKHILTPAMERIKASNSDVWFEFELKARKKVVGKKPKADVIVFRIMSKNPHKAGGDQFDQYRYVYSKVSNALNNPTTSSTRDIVDKVSKEGRLDFVYNRCRYYDNEVYEGRMVKAKAENSLLKMLREDFGVDTTKHK